MANRERRRRPQKKGAPGIGAFLQNLKDNAEKQNAANQESEPEDLNILPLPSTQDVGPASISWNWYPTSFVNVIGLLFTKGAAPDKRGTYTVRVSGLESSSLANPVELTGDDAKLIGQALISAWNYKNVWKHHAGSFIEREQMGEYAPKPPPPPIEIVEDEEDDDEELEDDDDDSTGGTIVYGSDG